MPLSIATASASRTNDFVLSLMHWNVNILVAIMKRRVASYFGQLIDKVWILLAHVFRVPTEYADSAIFQLMHLSTKSIEPSMSE